MKKWEYDFELIDFVSGPSETAIDTATEQLNRVGEEGWEVIGLLPKMGHKESWTFALLKREKS